MTRKHLMLERGKDWMLFQAWSNVETHVMHGHGTIADAPGRSMSPTEAAKLVVKMKKDGWREKTTKLQP
jgi:hypothetical protein